jgi:hypothetical protein
MVPLCRFEEVRRMLVMNWTWIIRELHFLTNSMASPTRNISCCDSVWNNRRNAPKFLPQSPEKKKWDTVGSDHSSITATR